MSGFHDNVLLGASGSQGYRISRSVRLRSSASAYFNRTFGTPTDNLKWTWSAWAKLGLFPASGYGRCLFGGGANDSGNNTTGVFMDTSNKLYLNAYSGGASQARPITTAVFRDPSAWYHVVCVYDSANATQADRFIFYVNGVRQAVTGTLLSQNLASKNNANGVVNRIGMEDWGTTYGFDGYLTEVNFIDGQALTPLSFGETNPVTGVWQPKKYTGTYGTNGFYLNFSDNSAATAAAIGKDYSGNGNNWTPNNISVTAGATYDSMLDVPTQWADGGNGRGNYATLNALQYVAYSLTNGNLNVSVSGVSSAGAGGTMAVNIGKWYFEITPTAMAASDAMSIGVREISASAGAGGAWNGGVVGSYVYRSDGAKRNNGTSTVGYGASYTTNDVVGVALDLDAGTITFYKNNASQGQAYSGLSGTFQPSISTDQSSGTTSGAINFGQRPFAYTPPSGFKALNTLNLPEPTILKGNQYFDATTYTGTGASLNVVNSGGMQPDFVWTKPRSTAVGHTLFDSLRGVTKYLQSNTTGAEGTAATSLTAFNSDGFTVNSDTSTGANGVTYVGWQWKEGATQGFDIVTYTGTSGAQNVSHNLGVAPKLIFVKQRTGGAGWRVYSSSLANTQALELNATSAAFTQNVWNNTTPTSSVFSVTDAAGTWTNGSGNTYVAYLFAEVAGFSKFGSYTGNGSADGPFVFCGFRPRWIMWKKTNSATNAPWVIVDTSRSPYNLAREYLLPNASDAETSVDLIDVLSNGFKWRGTAPGGNASGDTYIFAAFAESPFKNSLAR